jgi:hypothetical protein
MPASDGVVRGREPAFRGCTGRPGRA